jgi:hypothetical protein
LERMEERTGLCRCAENLIMRIIQVSFQVHTYFVEKVPFHHFRDVPSMTSC